MRILVVGLNFIPELTGIGKFTGDMAEWLSERGHSVKVVTSPPYYPHWRAMKGYSAWRYRRERIGKMRVWRCPLYVPRRPTGLKRVLHLSSFAMTSAPVAKMLGLLWRPDVVWCAAPALLSALGAWAAARLGGAKAWLHVQDLEVDAAFGLKILSTGPVGWAVRALERFLMRRFDKVSTVSQKMADRLVAKGVPAERVSIFPNWVDASLIHPLSGPSRMKEELGIHPASKVALYSGNMGEKQGLEIVVEAARARAEFPSLTFVLCGDGAARRRTEEMAAGLANVRFIPLQPLSKLNELLNMADVHLLPQRAQAGDLVMPSRLSGMMASGRPVVATAEEGTQLAEAVRGRGIVVPPGDAKAFEEAVVKLIQDDQMRQKLGQAGRVYALSSFGRAGILKSFEEELVALLTPGEVK